MKKEIRLYVLDMHYIADHIYNNIFEEWDEFYKKNGKQCVEAKEFMSDAVRHGAVYSLTGFMNALNSGEVDSDINYFYITEVVC